MSKQNKQRNKRAARKIAKSGHSGRHHLEEGQAASKVSSLQTKPAWVKATGKKGWWRDLKAKPHAKAA